jgi:hypothetical protein
MRKMLPLVVIFFFSCGKKEAVSKERIAEVTRNYYLFQTRDVQSIDDLIIDSIVSVTEKKQLENALQSNEKKYTYFIEAKDDEYADSTSREIERLQEKLKKADDTELLFFTVYHTISFTGKDRIPRKRQSNLDITTDYKIKPNAVTEGDLKEGVKGERLYKKPYSF